MSVAIYFKLLPTQEKTTKKSQILLKGRFGNTNTKLNLSASPSHTLERARLRPQLNKPPLFELKEKIANTNRQGPPMCYASDILDLHAERRPASRFEQSHWTQPLQGTIRLNGQVMVKFYGQCFFI